MKCRALVLCLFFVSFGTHNRLAQDWAKERLNKSPRHNEWVDLKHGDRTVKAFVVYPEVKTKAPAVLVIHEIFGLTDWAKNLADELAAAGYIAIAPDLLSAPGQGHAELSRSGCGGQSGLRLAGRADFPRSRRRGGLRDEAAGLQRHPRGTGFCWGGGKSFALRQSQSASESGVCLLRAPVRK